MHSPDQFGPTMETSVHRYHKCKVYNVIDGRKTQWRCGHLQRLTQAMEVKPQRWLGVNFDWLRRFVIYFLTFLFHILVLDTIRIRIHPDTTSIHSDTNQFNPPPNMGIVRIAKKNHSIRWILWWFRGGFVRLYSWCLCWLSLIGSRFSVRRILAVCT